MSAPLNPVAAARRMCEQSDWTLTNLELQKMLYIAHMFYLGKHGEPLIRGRFEAWDYGPVQPDVYNAVKMFGSSPIQNVFFGAPPIRDEARQAVLDRTVRELSSKTAAQLVAITHWGDGAWARNYQPNVKGILIPEEDIIDEYNERQRRLQQRKQRG